MVRSSFRKMFKVRGEVIENKPRDMENRLELNIWLDIRKRQKASGWINQRDSSLDYWKKNYDRWSKFRRERFYWWENSQLNFKILHWSQGNGIWAEFW